MSTGGSEIKFVGTDEDLQKLQTEPDQGQQTEPTQTQNVEQPTGSQAAINTNTQPVQTDVVGTEKTVEQSDAAPVVTPPVKTDWYKELLGLNVENEQEAISQVKNALESSKKLESLDADIKLAGLVKSGQYGQYERINNLIGEDGTVKDPIELAKYKFATEQSARLGKQLTNAQVDLMWNKHIEKNYGEIDLSAGEPDFDQDPEAWTAYNDFLASEVGKSKEWALQRKQEVEEIASKALQPQQTQQFSEEDYKAQMTVYSGILQETVAKPFTIKLDETTPLSVELKLVQEADKPLNPFMFMTNRWKLDPESGSFSKEAYSTIASDVAVLSNIDEMLKQAYRLGENNYKAKMLEASRNTGTPNTIAPNQPTQPSGTTSGSIGPFDDQGNPIKFENGRFVPRT